MGQKRAGAGRSKRRGGHFPRSGTKQRLESGLAVIVGQPRRIAPFLTHDHWCIPYGGITRRTGWTADLQLCRRSPPSRRARACPLRPGCPGGIAVRLMITERTQPISCRASAKSEILRDHAAVPQVPRPGRRPALTVATHYCPAQRATHRTPRTGRHAPGARRHEPRASTALRVRQSVVRWQQPGRGQGTGGQRYRVRLAVEQG